MPSAAAVHRAPPLGVPVKLMLVLILASLVALNLRVAIVAPLASHDREAAAAAVPEETAELKAAHQAAAAAHQAAAAAARRCRGLSCTSPSQSQSQSQPTAASKITPDSGRDASPSRPATMTSRPRWAGTAAFCAAATAPPLCVSRSSPRRL